MGIAERRAREKDALRHKLLEAAVELFLQNGFEIVTAICTETFETLVERLEENEGRDVSPRGYATSPV